jgi:glycine hydroxymethyltransferase
MTSRGCVERDLEIIAEFIFKAAQIASNVQREHGKLSKDFLKGLQHNMEIPELRTSIKEFASQFEMSGFDVSAMKYNS